MSGYASQVNIQPKRGVLIIAVDPKTKLIEAETRNGEVITVNAYFQDPAFRWPMSGENWMVREENGSWFLDGLWEVQEPGVTTYSEFECPGSQYPVGYIVEYEGKLWRRAL